MMNSLSWLCRFGQFFIVPLVLVQLFGNVFVSSTISNPAEEVSELRRKWGAGEIIRDLQHIEEDVAKVMKLQESGDISSNEAVFYFLKMHDFDDNHLLDGHEILAAIRHSVGHGPSPAMNDIDIASIVDPFFDYDDDGDGYLSYLELRKNTARE